MYQPLLLNAQLWDYEEKKLLMVRTFDGSGDRGLKLVPKTIAYDPEGNTLAVGCATGSLKLLEASRLGDISTKPHLFRNSKKGISHVCFSHDGRFMASAGKTTSHPTHDGEGSIGWFARSVLISRSLPSSKKSSHSHDLSNCFR